MRQVTPSSGGQSSSTQHRPSGGFSQSIGQDVPSTQTLSQHDCPAGQPGVHKHVPSAWHSSTWGHRLAISAGTDAIVDGAAFCGPRLSQHLGPATQSPLQQVSESRHSETCSHWKSVQAPTRQLSKSLNSSQVSAVQQAPSTVKSTQPTNSSLMKQQSASFSQVHLDRFARARFDTSLPYLWIAQATFRTRATSFETETIDTGGATVTGVFGRTRVRAEALVDANRARRGIAASPALATIGETAAFAGDADARPGEPGAADLRFRIAARTAAIGLLVADKARIGAIGIGAAGAVDRSVIADPTVGAAIAAGEQIAAGIDATDIRHLAAATAEGLLRATELVATPADSVATPVELAAELVGPAALRSIGRRADVLQRRQLAVTVVRRAAKLFAVAGTSAAGAVATLGMAGEWRGNRIFGAAGGPARFQSGRTAAPSGTGNLLPRAPRRFGRRSRPSRGEGVILEECVTRDGDASQTEQPFEH